MADRIYLDWNATAPLRPAAARAAGAAMQAYGNPSSVHAEGRAARTLIEDARNAVARLANTRPENVTFTSGGTEANALALSPLWAHARNAALFTRLLVSAIEHPSVLAGGRFAPEDVETIPVGADGIVDCAALAQRLQALSASGERVLVSVMLANNETGVVQPIREIAEIVHEHGFILHVDAVHGAGRLPLDITDLGADLLTLSAHKIGGPKGAGALIRREEALHLREPLIRGGGQERGLRAGTENVAAIAGFGAAATEAHANLAREAAHMARLRERLESGLRSAAPQSVIFGADAPRLPNTTLAALPGASAETALIAFDLDGFALSSGAACSSGKVQTSHVLAAMGVDAALARCAIRISTGPMTTELEIDQFIAAWKKRAESLPKEGQGIAA